MLGRPLGAKAGKDKRRVWMQCIRDLPAQLVHALQPGTQLMVQGGEVEPQRGVGCWYVSNIASHPCVQLAARLSDLLSAPIADETDG